MGLSETYYTFFMFYAIKRDDAILVSDFKEKVEPARLTSIDNFYAIYAIISDAMVDECNF